MFKLKLISENFCLEIEPRHFELALEGLGELLPKMCGYEFSKEFVSNIYGQGYGYVKERFGIYSIRKNVRPAHMSTTNAHAS